MLYYVNDKINIEYNMYMFINVRGSHVVYWYDCDAPRSICYITGAFKNHRNCKNVYDCPEEVSSTKEELLRKVEQFILATSIKDLLKNNEGTAH